MKLQLQLFAGLAEKIGSSHITLDIEPNEITAGQLKEHLSKLYPLAADIILLSFIAKNQTYAPAEEPLNETDELALIPPVSGGESKELPLYSITYEPISVDTLEKLVLSPSQGAALTFIGTTREYTAGKRTTLLEYEAYIPMALSALEQIGRETNEQWPGTLCAISHRLGKVAIGEISVVIAISAPHRSQCYNASRYAIERLKQIVPIWKKEIWEDGSEWKDYAGSWNPISPLIAD